MRLTDDAVEELNKLTDTFFKKVGRKERLRRQILRSMDESEAYLYPKIREWLQGAREQIIKDIRKKILRKGLEQEDHPAKIEKKSKSQIVVDYVDWEIIENNGKSIVKPAYLNIMEKSGNLARQQGRIEASFDVINPQSVESAEKYSYDLVTNVGKETKAGLRAIVTHGMKKGKTLAQIAKEIKSTGIGLNERQVKTLLKYGDALEAQGITGKLYQEKWKKYFNRLQRDRSKMIARTEVSRSANEGYLDSLEGTRYEEVELSAAADACPDCLALVGQKFKRSEARGMLPIHPNCRCHWIVVIPKKKKPRIPIIPRVPRKPKPEARKIPRRGHLPSHLEREKSTQQLINDAKKQNITLTQKEAEKIIASATEFTQDSYPYIRTYQRGGISALKKELIADRKLGYSVPKSKDIINQAKNVEKYIKHSAKYQEKVIYRGIRLSDEEAMIFKKNQIIDMEGTSSFSSNYKTSRKFGNVIFKVKNKTGCSVKHISGLSAEEEIILSKNSKFRITSVRKIPHRYVPTDYTIGLEEL